MASSASSFDAGDLVTPARQCRVEPSRYVASGWPAFLDRTWCGDDQRRLLYEMDMAITVAPAGPDDRHANAAKVCEQCRQR
jgi:hypothetical protein